MRKEELKLEVKPTDGAFQVVNRQTQELVLKISNITWKKMIAWLNDYALARPSMIAIVDLFQISMKIENIHVARAIVHHWMQERKSAQ